MEYKTVTYVSGPTYTTFIQCTKNIKKGSWHCIPGSYTTPETIHTSENKYVLVTKMNA